MCFCIKLAVGFVKADMSVPSDSEKLKINSALFVNKLLVFFTFLVRVGGKSVWNICP